MTREPSVVEPSKPGEAANRIDSLFARSRTDGRKALVVYATSGDPDPATSHEVFEAAAAGGADVVEIGVPFSDPTADGTAIQQASERALKAGGGFTSAFADARAVRRANADLGIVLFGYANPFLQAHEATGNAGLALAQIGADAVLCVDMPPEEDTFLGPALAASGLHSIRLIAPTSTDARIERAALAGGGFLYCVSVTGVTGGQGPIGEVKNLEKLIARIRKASILPVVIGFGIDSPESAARMAAIADGVVVGSAIVRLVAEHGRQSPSKVEAFVRTLRRALD